MPVYKNNRAFSLVELLISIVIFGFISAGIVITMRSSMQSTLLSRNLDDLNINVHQALNIMKQDIENAGRYVSQGIWIPNNPAGSQMVNFGFDITGCRNDIASDITVTNIAGDDIGIIPEGTDTIAITTMAPPIQLDLRGCDPDDIIMPQGLTNMYFPGAPILSIADAGDFTCYFNNTTTAPVYAVLFSRIGNAINAEMFSIANINLNNLTIANDGFSIGRLNRAYNADDSFVYMLGPNANAGKIEYFILESDETNPKDPNVPIRQLVKRVNNRDIYIVADNITNVQFVYTMNNSDRLDDISTITLRNDRHPVLVDIFITVRSGDMIRGDANTPDNFDPLTGTNIARYVEETHHSIVTVKGTTYKATDQVATPHFP